MTLDYFKKNKAYGPKVLRYFFGIAFLVAALDKMMSMGMAKGMFEGMFGAGLGGPILYLAILIEVVGGLALLFNKKVREVSVLLSIFIAVALWKTWMLGDAMHFAGTLREMLVMNTGGGNTAVNFAYLAGLLSLAFSGSDK